MNCKACGATIPTGARFCPSCGAGVAPAASGTPPPSEADSGYARFYDEDSAPKGGAPAQPAAPVPPAAPVSPPPAPEPYPAQAAPATGYQAAPPQSPPSPPPYQGQSYGQQPGQYPASPPPYASGEPTTPVAGSPNRLPWILGGVALIAVALAALYGIMSDGPALKPIDDKTLAEQSSESPEAVSEEPTIVKPAESLFVAAEANVRDKPTVTGSKITRKIARASAITGDVVAGEKGDQWLRIAGTNEYVSLINLTNTALPALVSNDNIDATIRAKCPVLTQPSAGAPVKLTLQPGAKVKITGLTAGDFAEFALPKGGVGYAASGGDTCLIAPEVAPTPTGSSGDYAPPGSDNFDEPAPDDEEG